MPRVSLQQLLLLLTFLSAVIAVVGWVKRSSDADMQAIEAERVRRGPPPVMAPRQATPSVPFERPEQVPRYYPQGF